METGRIDELEVTQVDDDPRSRRYALDKGGEAIDRRHVELSHHGEHQEALPLGALHRERRRGDPVGARASPRAQWGQFRSGTVPCPTPPVRVTTGGSPRRASALEDLLDPA